MSRVLLLLVAVAGAVAGAAAGGTAGQPPAAPAPRPIPVDELVRQLAGPDVAARAAAEARLSALGLAPPPDLLAVAAGPDADARARAARAAREMRANAAAAALERGERFAAGGRVDLFVAATAGWELDADDPRLWDPVLRVGRALVAKSAQGSPVDPKPDPPSERRDFAEYRRVTNVRITRSDRAYAAPEAAQGDPLRRTLPEAVQAPGVVSADGLGSSVVVSRGGVRAGRSVRHSLVLATGDVAALDRVSSSVVVCDGDVTIGDEVMYAVVVARGDIRVKGRAYACELVAGGAVVLGREQDYKPAMHNIVTPKEPRALGWVRFFELSDVGLGASAAGGEVRLTAVAGGSAGEAAGLRAGDVVLEAGGRRAADAAGLRRALRDALAVGDAAVTVKRGADTRTVRVALPDDRPAEPPVPVGK